MNSVDYRLQGVPEIMAHHTSRLSNRSQPGRVAQHPRSFLNQVLQVFRTCPKLRLTLFQTVDIDKSQDHSLDLVIRRPVWPHPDHIPAPLRALGLYLLADGVVDYLVYYRFEVR